MLVVVVALAKIVDKFISNVTKFEFRLFSQKNKKKCLADSNVSDWV